MSFVPLSKGEACLLALRQDCVDGKAFVLEENELVLSSGRFPAGTPSGYVSSRTSEVYPLGPVALLLSEMVFGEKKISKYVAECSSRAWRPVAQEDRRDLIDLLTGVKDGSQQLVPTTAPEQPAPQEQPIQQYDASRDFANLVAAETASLAKGDLVHETILDAPEEDDKDEPYFPSLRQRDDWTQREIDQEAYAYPFPQEVGVIPDADFSFVKDIIDKVRKEEQDKARAARKAEDKKRRDDKEAAKQAAADAKKAEKQAERDKRSRVPEEEKVEERPKKEPRLLPDDNNEALPPAPPPPQDDGAPPTTMQAPMLLDDDDDDGPPPPPPPPDDPEEPVITTTTAPQKEEEKDEPTKAREDPPEKVKERPPPRPKERSGTVHRHSSGQPQNGRIAPYIIVVPSGSTAPLTLLNAADFLGDGRYVSNDAKRAAGTKREASVTIEHTFQNDAKMKFRIVDNPTKLETREWDKVVAVFAVGPTWQFKNWKIQEPVDLFHKVLGVHLQFDDEATPDTIRHWNVRVLKLSKTKRHLDTPIALDFWRLLDEYLQKRKAQRSGTKSKSSSSRHHSSSSGTKRHHSGHPSSSSEKHHRR